ncbi:uncharacterized protein [Watersipora subatra]|uniref:uncharacterized protein n=1 Tax=Watersipora subatra TaxID=2589382 RepID=UPI00355BD266
MTDKLAAIKANIREKDQVVTLLGSLPESYSMVVTALEARGDNITLQFATQTLLNEEQKREQRALTPASDSGSVRSKANSDTALLDNSKDDESAFTVLETDVDSQKWMIDSGATSHMAKQSCIL